MSATLCDVATNLPAVVGHLLDQEAKLKRGRFREETMTDILTGALAAFAGPNLVIEYPKEDDTGGDLDLRFWHVAGSQELHVRLQAKRLNASKKAGSAVKTAHRAYEQLLHKAPTAKDYQFRVLRDAPHPWLPLYLFYNHNSVVQDVKFGGDPVRGINLAFSADIAAELEAKLAASAAKPKKVLHHKRLSRLRKHFFGLDALLCPNGDWKGEPVPTPDLVAGSLRERFNRIDEADGTRRSDTDRVIRALLEPDSLLVGSDVAVRLPDGPAMRATERVQRPTLTFITGRTGDSRTPKVTNAPQVDD